MTYANVVSTLCLFIVLGGGAYAASQIPPDNSVGTRQVKDFSLLRKDVKRGQLPNRVVSASAHNNPPATLQLSGTLQPMLATTIKTKSKSRIIATATVEATIQSGGAIDCVIDLGRKGTFTQLAASYDDTSQAENIAVPVTGVAAARPPGTYVVRLSCRDGPPDAGYISGDLGVVAIGS